MNAPAQFNHAAREYLNAYRCILRTMIQRMTEAELTDSISRNFIVQMIPHHQAAIEMSHNILNDTTDKALQEIASGIIEEQTKSIQNMCSIMECCGRCTNEQQALCQYQCKMRQIMQAMFCKMSCACATNQNNCNFMREMIPHHEGAIEMSQLTLSFDICPELKPILQAIIVSQEKGVMEMKRLMRCLNCC